MMHKLIYYSIMHSEITPCTKVVFIVILSPNYIGPHRGIPNILAERNNHVARISNVPTVSEAVTSYYNSGGTLSPVTLFGTDPLSDSPELFCQRQRELELNNPTPEELFAYTVNGNYIPFAQSLHYLIQTTIHLERQL